MADEKKPKFSRIVVAIDGSYHSMKAVEYAIDIARDNKAQLIALTGCNYKIGYAASASSSAKALPKKGSKYNIRMIMITEGRMTCRCIFSHLSIEVYRF
ncbi:MAG TPA: universal stress protein [Nitrososphaeraceae archaeon]|nr:universal stress protein [Nitrososphaeraceae archaeon]